MDLSDLNVVASRKRIITNGEKLRENVTRGSSKLIKLRVAQDTAYWDLQERLKGLEAEHDRLKQNMVELQMQNETLSTLYQDEQRLRPDTVNKLGRTSAMCDMIQEYSSNMRESLRRTKNDRDQLAAAYYEAGALVDAAVRNSAETAQRSTSLVNTQKDQLRQSLEIAQYASQGASETRRTAIAACDSAHAQVAAAEARQTQLVAQLTALQEQLQEKDRSIQSLYDEMARHAKENHAEAERAAEQRHLLQGELESSNAALATEQARGTATLREAERLSVALADIETTNERLVGELKQSALLLQNAEATCANQKEELKTLGAEHEAVLKNVGELEREKSETLVRAERVERALEEAQAAREVIESELRVVKGALEAEREAHATVVANAEEAKKSYQEANEAQERMLAESVDAVNCLMSNVAREKEARARSDSDLAAARTDLDQTQQSLESAKEQIRAQDFNLNKKEDELGNQMKVILELRKDKDRLNNVISDMQGTIGNIQKELARPPPVAFSKVRRDPPELDDNAMPAPSQPISQTPATRDNAHTELYRFLNDDSLEDGDSLLGGCGMLKIGRPARGDVMAQARAAAEAAAQRPRTFFKTKRNDKPKKKTV